VETKVLFSTTRGSRRTSQLGDLLAKQKIDAARTLTPEQRLLLALELSDAAVLLRRACSKKPWERSSHASMQHAAKGCLTPMRLLVDLPSQPGVPRATQDIDFAVAIGTKDPRALATFMGGRYDAGGPDDPLRGVIRASVTVPSGSVPLQLIFLSSAFSDVIFQRVETLSLMNQSM
jgi:hypothetical protein